MNYNIAMWVLWIILAIVFMFLAKDSAAGIGCLIMAHLHGDKI
jgi:hypothetical protein